MHRFLDAVERTDADSPHRPNFTLIIADVMRGVAPSGDGKRLGSILEVEYKYLSCPKPT
jgi:hypothetical protein